MERSKHGVAEYSLNPFKSFCLISLTDDIRECSITQRVIEVVVLHQWQPQTVLS